MGSGHDDWQPVVPGLSLDVDQVSLDGMVKIARKRIRRIPRRSDAHGWVPGIGQGKLVGARIDTHWDQASPLEGTHGAR
jgi:hypothetical protein